MAVSLSKGGRVSLSKAAPGLRRIHVGLGWDAQAAYGAEFDLDASAFLLNSSNLVRADTDFIFYNNLTAINGAVAHQGDNLTGVGDGDDEVLKIDLKQLQIDAANIEKIAIVVSIHEATTRRQNFGQVENAFIRIVNDENNQEIVRFDLTEGCSTETAMIFGEIYQKSGEWGFTAVGQGHTGGLAGVSRNYGIDLMI